LPNAGSRRPALGWADAGTAHDKETVAQTQHNSTREPNALDHSARMTAGPTENRPLLDRLTSHSFPIELRDLRHQRRHDLVKQERIDCHEIAGHG
jgi:hypothetical protein